MSRYEVPRPGDHDPIAGPHDVSLRPIAEGDIEAILRWRSDPEVAHWWDEVELSLPEMWRNYLEPDVNPCWRFIIELAGRGIGVIQYHHPYADTDYSFTAGIDIFIGEGEGEGEGEARDRGVGREALRVLLGYLFEVKRVHRVTIDPEVGNARAIRAYERAGFRLDGVVRHNDFIRGEYVDTQYLTILENEWPAARARWFAERAP